MSPPDNTNIENEEIRELIDGLVKKKKRELLSVEVRTKGRLGELMTTMLFDQCDRNNISLDICTFETPFGRRRIDNFLSTKKQAVESKNGYVSLRKGILNQIKKDAYLLEQGTIKELIWVCFKGLSKNAKKYLDLHHIKHVDLQMEFDAMVGVNNKTDENNKIEVIEV